MSVLKIQSLTELKHFFFSFLFFHFLFLNFKNSAYILADIYVHEWGWGGVRGGWGEYVLYTAY